ncbi:MAG: hypothetical protein AAFQ67_02500 [Pseudomonadota bacterium]
MSLAQDVGLGHGAQSAWKRLTDVLNQDGFNQVRRESETAANIALEARA